MYAYARVHERVDAALAAYSAPTLRRLEITVPYGSPHLTSGRVSSWLRFASRRLAGDLLLSLPHRVPDADRDEEILIPPSQRATAIHIEHVRRTLRFLPLLPVPVAGGGPAFVALATLRIKDALVDSRELEDVLSSRCPRLKELALEYVTPRDGPAVFSISSGSLQRLERGREQRRVRQPAPGRRARAPGADPTIHLLRRLHLRPEALSTLLGVQQYEKLLEDTSKLAKCCEALVLRFMVVNHEFKPILVHLLQQCHGIRKLSVEFNSTMGDYPCKSWGCPCSRLENRKTNRIVLHSLEEVQVKGGGDEADHKAELVRMLCKCHATFKKKVSISVQGNTYTRQRICRFVPPNDKYEITVSSVL
ncbi:unnamed protein product [Urochloa decumbens]|uniref:FBD domain-containing protein n=1 Tax=Urochloa decumbens TaxID=240449 RepID=A0ABC9EQF4_9POAL